MPAKVAGLYGFRCRARFETLAPSIFARSIMLPVSFRTRSLLVAASLMPVLSLHCTRRGDGDDNPGDEDTPPSGRRQDRNAKRDSAMTRYGADPERMAWQIVDLEEDNRSYREKNGKLKTDKEQLTRENEELKGKLPKDGTVILTAEQAQQWEAYQKFGKPEEIGSQLQQGRDAIQFKETRQQEDVLTEAAGIEKWNADALKLAAQGQRVVVREVEVLDQNGAKTMQKRPFVATAKQDGSGDDLTPLGEVMKAKGDGVMRLLQAQLPEGNGQGGQGQQQQQSQQQNGSGSQNGGNFFPAQNVGGTGNQKGFDLDALDNQGTERYNYVLPDTKK